MKSMLSVTLLTTLMATHVQAESVWGLGLGAVANDNGYVDVGTEVNAVPVVFYQSEDVYLLGPNFGYNMFDYAGLEFSLVGQYRFDGFKEEDEEIFRGMEERSGSLDLGFSIGYDSDYGNLSFEYVTDVTSEHEGNEMSLSYSLPYRFDTYEITPFIKANRMSDDLVDYYYGVRANEVTQSRAFYQADASTNFEVGVNSRWQMGKHHNFIGNLSYQSFGAEIKDSPLVDKSGGLQLVVGYMYVF